MNSLSKYEKYRPEMKTGDCLLWRSHDILGGLIRVFSHYFNHAGLVICLPEYQGSIGRIWTHEAVSGGVELNLLSERIQTYHGEVWWLPLEPKYDDVRRLIGEYSLSNAGCKYDYGSLFKNILGHVSANARKLFCSELVFLSYKYAGLVTGDIAPRPGDIQKYELFSKIIQIV